MVIREIDDNNDGRCRRWVFMEMIKLPSYQVFSARDALRIQFHDLKHQSRMIAASQHEPTTFALNRYTCCTVTKRVGGTPQPNRQPREGVAPHNSPELRSLFFALVRYIALFGRMSFHGLTVILDGNGKVIFVA